MKIYKVNQVIKWTFGNDYADFLANKTFKSKIVMVDKNRLMGHIISKGYSQRTLSEKIGVSKNTLNSKINGHSSFDVDLIEKICDTLSITDINEKAEIFLKQASLNRDENQRK